MNEYPIVYGEHANPRETDFTPSQRTKRYFRRRRGMTRIIADQKVAQRLWVAAGIRQKKRAI